MPHPRALYAAPPPATLAAAAAEAALFIATPDTVWNPATLGRGRPDRPLMGRASMVWPRRPLRSGLFWRLLIEYPFVRYAIVLFPIPVAMVIWPELALPISGAPLLMFLIVLYVEGNVLSVPTAAQRRALIPRDEAERGLDLLTVRARAALTRIAAGRGLAEGTLTLVIEQSPMAAVAPLTFASLRDGTGAVLRVTEGEAAAIRAILDDTPGEGRLDARLLHRINLSDNLTLRSVTLDAAGLSAHARLAALARGRRAGAT